MLVIGASALGAPLKIAIILPSSINDGEWSQGIYQSLLELVDEYGADNLEIAYSENMWNIADAEVAIRDYAAEGYGLVANRVEKREDLADGIADMMASDASYLLEIMVEKEGNVFPMIPTGASVSDIRLK